MTSRFPHLDKANGWPGLGTVDPFALQVTFDPYWWTPDVEIHLCKNRLDSGYRNVIGWSSSDERDAWYDAHSDVAFRLDSEMHVLPGQEIKLPVPFETLNSYNQLWIEFPPAPTQYADPRPYRFYYFITDIKYRSPSATACVITLDEWTTHGTEINIPYIALDRGHAPLAAVTVDEYLANPLENSELLTIQDDTYGQVERLQHEAMTMVEDGDVWCVLSLSINIFDSPGQIGQSDWKTPYTRRILTQGVPACDTIAIEPSDLPGFLDRMEEVAPQLLATIQGCYIISKKWLTVTATGTVYNTTVRRVTSLPSLSTLIDVDKDQFNYPSRYREIAKLYTSPYACIELSDEMGQTQRIRIEDTAGKLDLSVVAALTYPAIGIEAAVLGVGSDGRSTLSWDNFASHSTVVGGMWTQCLRHWDIPVYIITMDPNRLYALRQYYAVQQAQQQNEAAEELSYAAAQASYDMQNAGLDRQIARLAQQQYNDRQQQAISQNADDSSLSAQKSKMDNDYNADASYMQAILDNSLDMISLSNSQSMAANANAENAATVAQDVAVANQTAVSASVAVAQEQANVQHNMSLWGFMTSMDRGYAEANAIATASDIGGNQKMVDMMMTGFDEAEGRAQTQIQGVLDKIGGVVSGLTGGLFDPIGEAVAGGLTAGEYNAEMRSQEAQLASANGSVQQAQLALKGAQLNSISAVATYNMAAGKSAASAAQSQAMALSKIANAKLLADQQNNIAHSMQRSSLQQQQSTQDAITNGDVALGRSNASRTKSLADRNTATRKQLQDDSIMRGYRAAQLSSPQALTGGAYRSSYIARPKFLAARIVTQSPAAIAAAGDTFLRFGYRLAGRQWAISTLTPMSKFSYWRGDPAIADYNNNAGTYDAIRAMFIAGVMVWRDPADIGSTSIYDNRPLMMRGGVEDE